MLPSKVHRAMPEDRKLEHATAIPRSISILLGRCTDALLDRDGERWMSTIEDDALLSSLTIPGTHDSAAYTYPWPFIATQSLSILQQLNAGIRYLDLRCGIRDDTVEMVHGPYFLGQTLDEVLDSTYAWLDAHPTEAVVAQIKEDREPQRSKQHFFQAIAAHISAAPDRWRTANTTPTVGELRGKVQLFRRFFSPTPIAYGINVTEWADNPSTPFTIRTGHDVQLTIQDHYNFTDPVPLPGLIDTKGGDVSGLLNRASNDADAGHWYINFTSASEFNLQHQLTPKDVALGGYSFFKWIDGLNPRLEKFIELREGRQRYGVVVMDFPEQGAKNLIHALIQTNFASDSALTVRWRLIRCFVTCSAVFFSLAVAWGLACIMTDTGIKHDLRHMEFCDLLLATNLDA